MMRRIVGMNSHLAGENVGESVRADGAGFELARKVADRGEECAINGIAADFLQAPVRVGENASGRIIHFINRDQSIVDSVGPSHEAQMEMGDRLPGPKGRTE